MARFLIEAGSVESSTMSSGGIAVPVFANPTRLSKASAIVLIPFGPSESTMSTSRAASWLIATGNPVCGSVSQPLSCTNCDRS